MKIINLLPQLMDCMQRWKTIPTEAEFNQQYILPNHAWLAPLLEDFFSYRGDSFHSYLHEINWKQHRERILSDFDPAEIEGSVVKNLALVESLLNKKLEGNIVLFGGFSMMDGYARFHMGKHQVYLGLDDEELTPAGRDVLITHELTHVAREGSPETWLAHGLVPVMHHDLFVQKQPVVEHLFGEGFSCLVSELLNPNLPAGSYTYQNPKLYEETAKHVDSINQTVHRILKSGHYRELYDLSNYEEGTPWFAHYIWAWQWIRSIYHERGPDALPDMVRCSSQELKEHALRFEMKI